MSVVEDAVSRVDRDELVDLALQLCNIDSAGPTEGPAAGYVHDWLRAEGFRTRKVGLLADRYNVLGRLEGTGGGYSLLFNAHLDTAVRSGDRWGKIGADDPLYHSAWVEGDELVGEGVVNDKGPMAAFMIAGKAVSATRVPKGDLLLTAAIAETSGEPADDEPPGYLLESKDLGARYLAMHGGVADFALIAEGTGFSIVSVEAGMAWFRITWRSEEPGYYTPYLPERTTAPESPNMIVRAAEGVRLLEGWARDYQRDNTVELPGGVVVPKAQVGAIKGGTSHHISTTPQVCSLYLGAFTVPGADPLAIRAQIVETLTSGGVPPAEVELYAVHRGYEATNAERLEHALKRAHLDTFGVSPPPPDPPTSSMWRDVNVWNQLGIPALTYGPRSPTHAHRRALPIDSLYQAACVYTRVIMDLCNQSKPR